MELEYGFYDSKDTQNALKELYGIRFHTDNTIKISRLKYHLEKNLKVLQKKYQDIMNKYAEKDEKGNFIPYGTRFGVKMTNEDQAEKDVAILFATKFKLPRCEKIPIAIIPEISPDNLIALSPLLEDLDFEADPE